MNYIHPKIGNGGTRLVVSGLELNLSPLQDHALVCRFGSVIVDTETINASSISWISPSLKDLDQFPLLVDSDFGGLIVHFESSYNRDDFSKSGFTFSYLRIPCLNSTSRSGGNVVTVSSSYFYESIELAYKFGSDISKEK